MQKVANTLPQPRYVKKETVAGQVNELMVLCQGQFKDCNYAVLCTGPYPTGMIQIPKSPSVMPDLSINGLRASIARFCDTTWVEEVLEPQGDEAGTIIVKFAFNKNGDYSVSDAESEHQEVREMNELRQKWTTEEVLNELFTFINGLEL